MVSSHLFFPPVEPLYLFVLYTRTFGHGDFIFMKFTLSVLFFTKVKNNNSIIKIIKLINYSSIIYYQSNRCSISSLPASISASAYFPYLLVIFCFYPDFIISNKSSKFSHGVAFFKFPFKNHFLFNENNNSTFSSSIP